MIIDKLAFLHFKDKQLLMALSKGKDTYYIHGGKREGSETDAEALSREVREELSVEIQPETMRLVGVYEAHAHGKPPGTIVRMNCYTAAFVGELQPSSEIQDLAYYTYALRELVGPVDQLIFDDLREREMLR